MTQKIVFLHQPKFSILFPLLVLLNFHCAQAPPRILPALSQGPAEVTLPPLPKEPKTRVAEETKLQSPIPPKDCKRHLIISEFMANPEAAEDKYGEYVELFNTGTTPISLEGWKLSNGRGREFHFRDEVIVGPKETYILGGSVDMDLSGDIPIAQDWGTFSLPNRKGLLHLRNPCGKTVDRIRYMNNKPWPKSRSGVALERIKLEKLANRNHREWRLVRHKMRTGDRGTPGKVPASLTLNSP